MPELLLFLLFAAIGIAIGWVAHAIRCDTRHFRYEREPD